MTISEGRRRLCPSRLRSVTQEPPIRCAPTEPHSLLHSTMRVRSIELRSPAIEPCCSPCWQT